MTKRISILMGIYNCAATLPEAIDSILRTGKGVQMGVRASRPFINSDVPDEKLKAQAFAGNELRNVVRNYIHQGCLKWTGTVYPSMDWAKRVFPECSDEEAYAKLEEALRSLISQKQKA